MGRRARSRTRTQNFAHHAVACAAPTAHCTRRTWSVAEFQSICSQRRSQICGPQPMSVCHEDHRRVPVPVSIVLCGLDQLPHLSLGQVLSGTKLAIRPAQWRNCSFFDSWPDQAQLHFCWHFSPSPNPTARIIRIIRAVCSPTCRYAFTLQLPAAVAIHTSNSDFRVIQQMVTIPWVGSSSRMF